MVYSYPATLQNRHSYATLSQLKDVSWLNITDVLSDVGLLEVLEEASKQVDRYCNRFFYLCEDTRYFDGRADKIILDDDLYSFAAMNIDPTGSGLYQLSYSPTNAPPDFFLYPLNRTPTTTLEINWNGQYGTFYAGFRHNVQIQGVWGHGPDTYQDAWLDSGNNIGTTPLGATDTTTQFVSLPPYAIVQNGGATISSSPLNLVYGLNTPIVTSIGTGVLNITVPAGMIVICRSNPGSSVTVLNPWTWIGPLVEAEAIALVAGTPTDIINLTVVSANLYVLQPGMTIRVDSEQMYVLAVDYVNAVVTLQRGTMGTTAATHIAATEIYIAQYPQNVVRATLIIAKALYNARLAYGGAPTAGNSIFGEKNKGGDSSEVDALLRPYKRERSSLWVGD